MYIRILKTFLLGLCLGKERSHPHGALFQTHCRVEEEEMTETLENVLIFWREVAVSSLTRKWTIISFLRLAPFQASRGYYSMYGNRVVVTKVLSCQDYMLFLNSYYRAMLLIDIYFERNKSWNLKPFKMEG